jgi:hypothetical protein
MDSEMRELIERCVKDFRDSIRKAILVYVIFWFIPALAVIGAWVYIAIKFLP